LDHFFKNFRHVVALDADAPILLAMLAARAEADF
jgi:hypothetical protein